jgi:HD-GYP domain-containing protein (c-di-GMP phosphodiesterase class II)
MDRDSHQVVDFDDDEVEIVVSLASQAAIAITNMRLIHDLEALLQAIVKMVATAIDEKSPYTAGHVQRVAAIVEALCGAINAADSGPFAAVSFTPEQLAEISMAAWLHDVGKIVTPEHVIDKATKLECRYDRIGLVAHRIELLKHAEGLTPSEKRLCAQAGADGCGSALEGRDLDESLAFLMGVNQGGEFLSDERVAKVRELAGLEYECHGVRYPLLNANEVENLTIRKGTLTDQEREVINNHVAVGIKMLNSLHFPRKLRMVPAYAMMHHEKLDGSGYPLGLKAEEVPLAARVLAVADIFEALSSTDRPYKKANSVAVVMRIMGFMVKDGHVDRDVCDLMVESGLVARYVREHLGEEQWGEFEWQGKKYTV